METPEAVSVAWVVAASGVTRRMPVSVPAGVAGLLVWTTKDPDGCAAAVRVFFVERVTSRPLAG
ncbi:hypothetical protein ACFPJ1_18620 [Kribbella qitaiheensis]|uniref:hypothetical protein n=1 Tax=Kribbella qitaiheensis TaxID=1544730 RepID=UPI00361E9671